MKETPIAQSTYHTIETETSLRAVYLQERNYMNPRSNSRANRMFIFILLHTQVGLSKR